MTFSITQLFVPLPSGVVDGVTPTTVAAGTWLFNEVSAGGNLNLPVTSWQSGGVAWTELMITALGMATSDSTISLHAQAAFLDFCATGTVVFPDPTNPDGATIAIPVTPDPSIPAQNPTGAAGWLDVLADSRYNVQRNQATFASGTLLYVNTTGISQGTFVTGAYHTQNGFTGATYNNSSGFTGAASPTLGTTVTAATAAAPVVVTTQTNHGIVTDTILYFKNIGVLPDGFYLAHPSAVNQLTLTGTIGTGSYGGTGGLVFQPSQFGFVADRIGPSSNAGPGQINALVTSSPGIFVTNPAAFNGNPYESNIALAARCRAKLASLSLNGPAGAYNYAATTSSQILAAQTPPKTLTSAITREIDTNSLATGVVTVTIANANGPVAGVANVAPLSCTGNGVSPIVIGVSAMAAALMSSGMFALVTGMQGNTAANGYWPITVSGTNVTLVGSTGNGTWTSGSGNIEAGDVGLVDSIIQAVARPSGVTVVTQSAGSFQTNVVATAYVPLQFLADFGSNPTTNKGALAVQQYLQSLPIGGITGIDGAAGGVVPFSGVLDAIMQSGTVGGRKYTISVSGLLINGAGADLALGSTSVSVPNTIQINVQGV